MIVKVKRPKNDAPFVQKYLKKYGFLKGYSSAFSFLGSSMLRFPDMSDEKQKDTTALSSDWHAVGSDLYKAISLINDESSIAILPRTESSNP